MSIIISLTSTSVRLPVLKYTLTSLLEQSIKPDRIVLNLSKDKYLIDQGINEVPSWLEKLSRDGEIEIKWVKNTGPYRKFLPIYEECSDDDWIVTCDDDVIYGKYWLASLIECAKQNPNSIICGRARIPVKSIAGNYQSYLNWPLAPLGSSGFNLVPTGVSGILYRKKLLDEYIMTSDAYKQLAPKQDDLWFNLARVIKGADVVVSENANNHIFPINAPGSLTSTNVAVKLPEWSKLALALIVRLKIKTKSYLGATVCENDKAIKNLKVFKDSLK